ncbi:hypothetical protein QR680_011497 [Steinernema hermaphroditum]|uniref:Uncharacterized protein n=1 Tax=Steinernema hermaphroditum TaxID=289476 RepID=A0AA39HYP7_9BILA|nr:hypothetical protein QR680_011497 [Steinernema hermaphroditum]
MEGDLKEKKEKLEEKRKLLEKLEKERDEEKFKLVLHKNNKEIQGLKEASATKEREFKEEIENVTAAFKEQKSSLEAGTDARKERNSSRRLEESERFKMSKMLAAMPEEKVSNPETSTVVTNSVSGLDKQFKTESLNCDVLLTPGGHQRHKRTFQKEIEGLGEVQQNCQGNVRRMGKFKNRESTTNARLPTKLSVPASSNGAHLTSFMALLVVLLVVALLVKTQRKKSPRKSGRTRKPPKRIGFDKEKRIIEISRTLDIHDFVVATVVGLFLWYLGNLLS